MEFLDPKKKKRHNQRLFVGYFLVGVAILLSATILYFQSVGYDVDRKTGKVIQNGLIFVSSQPEPANVFVNGEQKDQTDSRLTVPAGSYSVELKRSGYRSWKQSFNLEGGSIERLQYVRLFPEKLEQQELAGYDTQPTFTSQSPDRKWIVVLRPGSQTSFDVYDAGDIKKPVQSLVLPSGLLSSGDGQSLKLVEWSTDNRHVLLAHAFSGQSEFIMVDRENPAGSLNLNKHLGITPAKIMLRDKKFNQVYVLSADRVLQRFNTETKQATKVAANIIDFKPYAADTLLLAESDPDLANQATVKFRDGDKDLVLRKFSDASAFLLDLAKFDGHWFVAAGAVNEGRIAIYRDPVAQKGSTSSSALAFSVLLLKDAQNISFSSNARFIMLNNGNKFAVYDADTNRRFYYEEPITPSSGQKPMWMDGHRIIVNNNSSIVVFDFNGTNRQTLVSSYPNHLPMFDRDYERLFTLTQTKDSTTKSSLTQTPLKLNLD